jgi:hypothetical protein
MALGSLSNSLSGVQRALSNALLREAECLLRDPVLFGPSPDLLKGAPLSHLKDDEDNDIGRHSFVSEPQNAALIDDGSNIAGNHFNPHDKSLEKQQQPLSYA